MAKYKAIEIANWFIARAADDAIDGAGEFVTHLKLQKLLYYAQGSFLALKDEPLFDAQIMAWTHGPVVPVVYEQFKDCGARPIEQFINVRIDAETEGVLEEVYNAFGQFSALKLREMTHSERPWKSVELKNEIAQEVIKEYFLQHYIAE